MRLVPIHEHNDCHHPAGSPEGGQFCSKGAVGAFAQSAFDEDTRQYVAGKSTWYSFPASGDWVAEKVRSWPAAKLRKVAGLAGANTGVLATARQGAYLEREFGVPDKPGYLTVYRLGSKAGGLENRNAASLWGLASFINQEGTNVVKRGMYVTAYYVKGDVQEGPRHYVSYTGRQPGKTR